MATKSALGKGLASLIPGAAGVSSAGLQPGGIIPNLDSAPTGATVAVETPNKDRHLGISMVGIEEIQANPFQPRREFDDSALQELAQSILTSGIIQPLVVRKGQKEGFELIAGERRLRAAKLAGLKQVPIVIRRSTDKESLELALIENIQRQDLNCVDEAMAYFQLMNDFSLTQEDIAEQVGKDRATVANYLRLLRLPEVIIDDLKKQVLTFGHGKALLGIDDPELRLRVRAKVLEKKLSVRETEALVESLKTPKPAPEVDRELNQDESEIERRLTNLSQELARHWATKVEVRGSDSRGKIVIHYSTRQELDRILEGMTPRT